MRSESSWPSLTNVRTRRAPSARARFSAWSSVSSQIPGAARSTSTASPSAQTSKYPTTRSSPSTTTRRFSACSASFASHCRISSPFIRRASPHASTNSRATSSASSSVSSLSRNELIECLRQREQVGELTRRLHARGLADAVDPDAAQPQLVRRRDVVEERRRHVHVPLARRLRAGEELLPVPVRRLVRADLLRDHDLFERHPDLHLRRRDQVVVGVGED